MRVEMDLGDGYPAAEVLGFLASRAIPGVEGVEGLVYRRTWTDRTGRGCIVSVDVSERVASVDTGTADGGRVVGSVRRLLDLDAPTGIIDSALRRSGLLRPLVDKRPAMRVPGGFDGFEIAVRAILGQQVTVKGASTIAGRIVMAHGSPLDRPDGPLTHLFPTPAVLATADLSSIGMPSSRGRTINVLADAVKGGLDLDGSQVGDEVRRSLLALPGIGGWTESYIAMRALRDPDAFPEGDLGLRRALTALGVDVPPARVAEHWRPWRAYAAMHLWSSLGDG